MLYSIILKIAGDVNTTMAEEETNIEEDLEEVLPIEVDVTVDNDEFEPAPDEDEEYEVEEILNKRFKKGQIEYLVKWKGGLGVPSFMFFSTFNSLFLGWDLPEHNTWEHSDNLGNNASETINEYEVKLQRQKIMMKYGPDSNISPRGFAR